MGYIYKHWAYFNTMIIKKIWKNKTNNQLLVSIPNYLNFKEGDNVEIVKTEKTASTKHDIIGFLILHAIGDNSREISYIHHMIKNYTTKRVVGEVLRELIDKGTIKKERVSYDWFYSKK